jgi:PAS domain S-box-containing protein
LEKYTDLYDFAPVGYFTLDHIGTIRTANLTAAGLLGIERSRLLGCHFGLFVADEYRTIFTDFLRKGFANQGSSEFCEVELHTQSNFTLIVQIEAVVLGTAQECRIAVIDITSRKRTEEELRQSHARLTSFANATFEAIVESDAGRIVDFNEQLALMLGYPEEELRGMEIAGFIAPEDRDWVIENVSLNRESIVEHAMLRKDGTRIFVEAHGCPIFPGSVKRYTAIRDVTESRQAKKSIQESEKKFRSIFEQSLDAIFISSKDGSIDAANPAACKMFGMTEQELCKAGRSGIVNPKDHRLALLLEERKRTGEATGELTFIRKNGEHFPVEISSVIDPSNQQRSTIILRDITERKKVEHELQESHCELELKVRQRTEELANTVESLLTEICEREKAESALRVETNSRLIAMDALLEKEQMLIQQSRQAAMGEMIGNIAHQWRQPLNTLGLLTQKLGFFYGQPIFNKEFLDTSVAKSMEIIQYMSKTIDDFRNFFKTDKDRHDFDVSKVINNTLTLLEGSLLNPVINVVIVNKDSPVVNGFQNEYSQVVLNILINARDVLVEREIEDPRVAITIFNEDDCAVVTVADNAGGVPEEIIDKIFDPYFTTKGLQQGTGVGLFMSKTIIEKNMGGRLTVCNTVSGAEFRIAVRNGNQV